MNERIDKLWQVLNNYDILNLITGPVKSLEVFKQHTNPYRFFIMNMNRALALYPDLCSMDSPKENTVRLRYTSFTETTFVNTITAMEVFLVDMIKYLTMMVPMESVDQSKLIDFIEEFNLEKAFFQSIKRHGNGKIPLYELIPERLDLQQVDKCRIAFSVMNIDLPRIVDSDQKLWNKIYGKNHDNYIQIRNAILHRGWESSMRHSRLLNLNFLEESILDLSNFVYSIESTVISRYKHQMQIPTQ